VPSYFQSSRSIVLVALTLVPGTRYEYLVLECVHTAKFMNKSVYAATYSSTVPGSY